MTRRSVVLPDPLGPSRATSSPPSDGKTTSFSATNLPKFFVTLRIWMLMVFFPWFYGPVSAAARIWRSACHSAYVLMTKVTSASTDKTEATANAAAN